MAFDHKEFDAWAEKLKSANKWETVRKGIVNDLANRILRLAKKDTPVGKYPKGAGKNGGTLKRSWATEVNETADSYEVTIFNDTSYASYVEYGHRKRGGKGWTPGKFMLTKAEIEVSENAEEYIKKKLEDYLRRYFGD